MSDQADNELFTLQQELAVLTSLARTMGGGWSFGGKRNLWASVGYPDVVTPEQRWRYYTRGGTGRRAARAFPLAAWREPPVVVEDEDPTISTEFETAWAELSKRTGLCRVLRQANEFAEVTDFAALLLGFDDVVEDAGFRKPVEAGAGLVYARAVTTQNASVTELEKDTSSPRYGLPKKYKIDLNLTGNDTAGIDAAVGGAVNIVVDASRVIHVTNTGPMDLVGEPILKTIYNDLFSLEIVIGGAAEMFWRGAFPGQVFSLDPNMKTPDKATLDGYRDRIEEYVHDLKRYLFLGGVKTEAIKQQIADPSAHVDAILGDISAATRIPKRVLTGSEAAELASSQDRRSWFDRVQEYRTDIAEGCVLRPTIDRLVETGTLPAPGTGGYRVSWPEDDYATEKERAETAKIRTEALAKYAQSGLDAIIPPVAYLSNFLGMTDDEAQATIEAADGAYAEDDAEGHAEEEAE